MAEKDLESVCVTGANGFIGSHIVRKLLESGRYKVFGTIRCKVESDADLKVKSKYSHLLKLPNASENLELVQADLMDDGCFDRVISKCNYVIHTACPFYLTPTVDDIHDAEAKLLFPAVKGTRNVLNSVEKYRDRIKRVVITSSTGALIGFADRVFGKVYYETDWNEKSSLISNPFAYSKTMAEREAWKWYQEMNEKYSKENNGKSPVEVVSLNPVLVIGPILQVDRVKIGGINELNFSNKLLYNHIMKSALIPGDDGKTTKADGFSMVDVRDVAQAHLLSLTQENISGERFVLVSEKYQWISMSRAISQHFPQITTIPLIIKDTMGEEEGLYKMLNFSNAKFKQYFQSCSSQSWSVASDCNNSFNFIPIEESILDTTRCFLDNALLSFTNMC